MPSKTTDTPQTLTEGQREQLEETTTHAWDCEREYGRFDERTKQAYSERNELMAAVFDDSWVPGRVSKGDVYEQIGAIVGLSPKSVGVMVNEEVRKRQ